MCSPVLNAAPARVLCVDDNRDAADTAAALLRLHGCDALACYDGPTALEVAAEFEPDACFVDLNMPGMDGDVVAGRLRDGAGSRPLLLACLTAMNGTDTADRVRQAGFHLHLIKPLAPADLLTVVRSLDKADAGTPADAAPV